MRWMIYVVLPVAMLRTGLPGAVGGAGEVQRSAGRVSPTIDAAVPPGGGFGATRHQGTLTLTDGTTHLFTVSGIGIQADAGRAVNLEAKGEVYQLQKLADFAGTYPRMIGELSPDRDTNTLIIENQHGVRMVVTVTVDRAHGQVRLVPSESGVTVAFEH